MFKIICKQLAKEIFNSKKYFLLRIIFITLMLFTNKTSAGPPFITDDPVPTDYKHSEIYLFGTINKINTGTTLNVPALELNYGLIPNVEINTIIPFVFNLAQKGNGINASGFGDIMAGIKYRFINDIKNQVQVAFEPIYTIPSGSYKRGLGNGRGWIQYPIWLQKSWGSWALYGGGGYATNGAVNKRNYFFSGCVLQKELNDTWTIGGEIYSQGANTNTTRSYTLFNLGGYYNITKNYSIIFTVGHSVFGENHLVSYIGMHWMI